MQGCPANKLHGGVFVLRDNISLHVIHRDGSEIKDRVTDILLRINLYDGEILLYLFEDED